jgi:EmrB/QacA subfamily drug resistance transporter
MAFLDGTVVNVALPSIGADLDAEVSGLQWIINGYMLMLASLILLSGSLGDRLGRRRMFVAGISWFAVASAICTIAPNLEVLVAGRVLQGIGGALLTPGSLAILQTSFRPEDRGRVVGVWSGLTSVAAAVGPFLGGWIIAASSWRYIFLINVPIAIVTIAIAMKHVPDTRDDTATGRLDVSGAVLATLGLAGLTYGLIEAGTHGLGSARVLVALAVGAACLAGFVLVEYNSSHPMLPPDIFANARFTGANLVTVVVYSALGTSTFLIVLYFQEVLGYSALESGAALLPLTVLMLGLSGRSGQLADRIGARTPMTIGPLLMAAGFLLMLRVSPDTSYLETVLPAMIVLGLGLVATVAPLMAVAAIPLAAGITGDAYRDPVAFDDGFAIAMWISAVLAAAGGVLAAVTLRTPARPAEEPRPVPAGNTHCALEAPPLSNCPGVRNAEVTDDAA